MELQERMHEGDSDIQETEQGAETRRDGSFQMFSSSIHCNAGGAECVDYIHPQCQSLSGCYQHSGIRPLRGPVEHALPRDSWYR